MLSIKQLKLHCEIQQNTKATFTYKALFWPRTDYSIVILLHLDLFCFVTVLFFVGGRHSES